MRTIIRLKILTILLISIFVILSNNVQGCKDIIACNNATKGDYNLLLKVRDPSRPDFQVLTIVPKGYQYTYHHPWNGKAMNFKIKHKIIGVVSKGDSIPNIVKPGMCFTDAGLAFGDADTLSNWKNPTKYGWDDFDWIRYSCQSAENEQEAVRLLTEDVVDKYHAPKVPENLFLVGPDDCYVIEADAIHYNTKKVDDFVVMTNYAKELWRKSLVYLIKAKSFDTTFEGLVRKGRSIRLGLFQPLGIRITDIGSNYIEVKQLPFKITRGNIIGLNVDLFSRTKINLGEGKTVGYFWVKLKEINGNQAKIFVSYKYKAWEDKMNDIIKEKVGSICVTDMMNWSRIHSDDLEGLRSMCAENQAYKYEGSMIYKIPNKNYQELSSGWFSPNHACSSVYVPVHICVNDIYDPYETGEAAEDSLNLLECYGHNYLSDNFSKTENVFLTEMKYLEDIFLNRLKNKTNATTLFTINDLSMQKQGFLTQKIWLKADETYNKDLIIHVLSNIWQDNYYNSIEQMKNAVILLNKIEDGEYFYEKIIEIVLSIVKTRIDILELLGKDTTQITVNYKSGKNHLGKKEYEKGFDTLKETFSDCNNLFEGKTIKDEHKILKNKQIPCYYLTWIVFSFVIIIIFYKKNKKE